MEGMKSRMQNINRYLVLLGLVLFFNCSEKEEAVIKAVLTPLEVDLLGYWQFQSVIEETLQVGSNTWTAETFTIDDCQSPSGNRYQIFMNFYFYDNADGYYTKTPQGKILRRLSTCMYKYGGDLLWKAEEAGGKAIVLIGDHSNEDVVLKYEILNPTSFMTSNLLELKLIFVRGQTLNRVLTYKLQRVNFNQHEKDDRPVSQRIVNNWKFRQLRDETTNRIYDLSACSSNSTFKALFDDLNIQANQKIVQSNRCSSITEEYSWSMVTNTSPGTYVDLFQTNDGTRRYIYGIQYIDKYQLLVRVVDSRPGLQNGYSLWFRNID